MKKQILILNLLLFILVSKTFTLPQTRPVRDDIGYCWNSSQFDLFIKWLDENCPDAKYESDNLVAGISPHDDYLYAGRVYYPLYKLIDVKEVVIFGVTHGTVRKETNDPKNVIILDEFNKWKGPYGDVGISPLREIIKQQLDPQFFMTSNKAHSIEHSIEGLIPFLQHYNRDVKIVPIMVTGMPFERMDSLSAELASIISTYVRENNLKMGRDIFFLFSNDANHYGGDFDNHPYGLDEAAHRVATDEDKRIADKILNGVITKDKIKNLSDELWPEVGINQYCPHWCGRYPVVFGLLTVYKIVNNKGSKMIGEVFKYSDTWTEGVLQIKGTNMGTTAPFSLKHWVGFLSAGFYMK